jgi:signal transduction histidine kinase
MARELSSDPSGKAGATSPGAALPATDDPRLWLAGLHERVLAIEVQTLDLQPAVQATADCLTEAGFAPERLSVAVLTRHPGLSGLGYVWTRGQPQVAFLERPPGFLDSEEHRVSPLHAVITTRAPLFLDQTAIEQDERFPIVRGFAQAGATAYLALPLQAARGDVHVLAMWTARPGGWTALEASHLARVIPLLTLLVEVTENRRLLGMIGTAHELTQRALAEQALRSADALVRQQVADMARLETERQARLATEQQLQASSRDLAERNAELRAITASLEDKVATRTRDLEKALARANAATQAKSRFLAMMSHEIRTPMHGVLGLGELLSGTELSAEQARYIDTMQTAGTALLSLLDGILDFSRIEANRVELEWVPLSPATLLEEVGLLLKSAADSRGVWLRVSAAADVPASLAGDPTRLRQIWVNLIGNALKFTERGGVTASLEVAARDAGTVVLRGRVQDTGMGIEPKALAHLWEPFSQADSTTARRFGGSGLGLAICKGLIEQMGGSLSVESEPGRGSVFTFTVPLRAHEVVARAAVVATPEACADLASLRILVVDDNPVNRLVTERQLARLGALPPALTDGGRQALARLMEDPFDVVLMDMQMPDMDGLETTRRLRALPVTRQPWVIGMTANAFPEDREACLAAGMDGFMSKPLSLATLSENLRSARLLPRGPQDR